MAEILLDNILRLFSTETFGKDKSAYYVGGEKKLMNLIEAGKIESDKPVNAQMVNGTVMLLRYYFIADALRKSNVKTEEMKTLKIVHNIFTVVALLVAMYIGGGIEATRSDIAWSYIIFFVVVVLLVTRFIYEDKKQNKNSL